MNPILTRVALPELSRRIMALPFDRVVYIYGDKDISAGETYAITLTDTFETRMYLLCYLGGEHCKSVSCAPGADAVSEQDAIAGMLKEAWSEAGLTEYFVDEAQWDRAIADNIAPVSVSLIRMRRDGLDMDVFENSFIVEVPTATIEAGHNELKTSIHGKLRKAAELLLIGQDGDDIIRQSCSDYNWGDYSLAAGNNDGAAVGVYPAYAYPHPVKKPVCLAILVDQDECLLPCSVDGTFRVTKPDGSIRCELPAKAAMTYGGVLLNTEHRVPVGEKDICTIDFGNGVCHAVARSKEDRYMSEPYYYIEDAEDICVKVE